MTTMGEHPPEVTRVVRRTRSTGSTGSAARDVSPDFAGPRWLRGLLRAMVVIAVVAAPVLFLKLVASVAGLVVSKSTPHPNAVVGAVAVGLGGVVAAGIWVKRTAVLRLFTALELPEVLPAAPAEPHEPWFRRLRPLRRADASWLGPAAAELAVYASVILAAFWPPRQWATTLRAFPGDGEGWAWLGWRVSREMSRGHIFPTRLVDAMHPYDINLLGGDGYMTAWISGVVNLFADPVLAYNLTQVVAVVLAAVAGRVLARTCTTDRVAIVVSTLAFATSPVIMVRFAGHQNLIFVFPAALIMAEVVRLARSDLMEVRWIRLTVYLVLGYLSSIYYLLFGLLVLALAVTWCLIRRRGARECLPGMGKVAAAAAITIVCMSPFLVTRFARDAAERSAGAPAESTETDRTLPYSADLYSSISPQPNSRDPLLRYSDASRDMETAMYPGALLLIGLGGAALVRTRVRSTILSAGASLWVLALGPTLVVLREHGGTWTKVPMLGDGFAWLPYTLLLRVPGLTSLRTPVRAAFWLVPVAAAGLAIFAGSVLHGRPRWLRVAVLVAGVLLVVGDLPSDPPVVSGTPSPVLAAAFEHIAHEGGYGAVLVLPDDCLHTWGDSIWEVEHHRPVVGCTWYSSSVPWYSGLDRLVGNEAWASLRCAPDVFGPRPVALKPGEGAPDPGDLQELTQTLGVRWVVFQKHPSQCNPARFAAVQSVLEEHATLLAEDDQYKVFELPS